MGAHGAHGDSLGAHGDSLIRALIVRILTEPIAAIGSRNNDIQHDFIAMERGGSGCPHVPYNSSLGRWMTPDWSATPEAVPYAQFDNPQSLNLYTYVLNNPVTRVDPDGHCDSSSKASANNKCQPLSHLHANAAGIKHVKTIEGDSNKGGAPSLAVYLDGAGNPTVGWGHKVTSGDHLKVGDKITKAQAEKLFS